MNIKCLCPSVENLMFFPCFGPVYQLLRKLSQYRLSELYC